MTQWFIDVLDDNYTFYYNMESYINENVVKEIGKSVANVLPRNESALQRIQQRGYMTKRGSAHLGMFGSFNKQSGQFELVRATNDAGNTVMAGVCAHVSSEIAETVLERAKYYCPVDTGILKNSGYIEYTDDGQCVIKFDCPYAWFVHEYTWKNHKYPTCAKFLSIAVQEVETWLQGLS